jgi:hypothetical protein
MNLMSSSSQSNPRLLGPYGGAYSALENLPIARVAGGVNTFGSNIFRLTGNNAICHMEAGNQLNHHAVNGLPATGRSSREVRKRWVNVLHSHFKRGLGVALRTTTF